MNQYYWSLMQFIETGDKTQFFSDSPVSFIFTSVGVSYVVLLFAISFLFGFIYQSVLKKVALWSAKRPSGAWKNRARAQNIGTGDRALRTVIGLGLFILAITTSWSPLLFFFSGFSFFEAIFSWCGLYAALGRNTCPIS